MILSKEDVKHLVFRVMKGMPVERACGHIDLSQDKKDFDQVFTDAIFDVWIHTGDSGYNRKGFRVAFDAVENYFFPKEKEEKVHHVDEHFTFDGYF